MYVSSYNYTGEKMKIENHEPEQVDIDMRLAALNPRFLILALPVLALWLYVMMYLR